MSGRSSKNKGANAEREVAAIILAATGVEVKRNLEQTRGGGYDLVGIDWLAIEVKRQEKLALPAWWRQTLAQSEPDKIPCLVYRQNRKAWIWVVGRDKKVMDTAGFIVWLVMMLNLEAGKGTQ